MKKVAIKSFGLLAFGAAAILCLQTSFADHHGAAPKPVEDSMHEFMEYVFEPGYKRLKANLAKEPGDKAGWKAIKGDALALAESTNLLFARAPKEDGPDWKKYAAAARGKGAALYAAARSRDYAAASKSWKSMLQSCNACPKQFADGKYQLKP